MKSIATVAVLAALTACGGATDGTASNGEGAGAAETVAATPYPSDPSEPHLRNLRQLTHGGENAEAYWAPDGRHLIFQKTEPPGVPCDQIFVMEVNGEDLHRVSTGQGRTTCAYYFPDGKRISMNLRIDRDVLRFVRVNDDGSELRKMLDETAGSGHPTVHPDGRHLLTDSYTHEPLAFGDGTIPLRWIDLATGEETTLVRINTEQPCADSVLRIDPHPAWDRTWRYVAFNAFVEGTRRVFLADLGKLVA